MRYPGTLLAGCVALQLVQACSGCRDAAPNAALDASTPNESSVAGGTGGQQAGGRGGATDAASETAGSGGSSGESGADARADYGWLLQDTGWNPVQGFGSDCVPRLASRDAIGWPGWAWQSCGPGCRETDAVPSGSSARAYEYASGLKVVGNEAYVGLTANLRVSPVLAVTLVVRLSDGQLVGAMKAPFRAECLIRLGSTAGLFLFEVGRDVQGVNRDYGWLDPSSGSVAWAKPTLTQDIFVFDFAGGWGGLFGRSSLQVTQTSGTTAFAPIYETAQLLSRPAVAGAAVLSAEWRNQGGAIVRYEPSAGAKVLLEGGWTPSHVAASRDRIVWLAVTGPRAFEGAYESARLMWSPHVSAPADARAVDGPVLPVTSAPAKLATGGSAAAMMRCEVRDRCQLLVAPLDGGPVIAVEMNGIAWLLGMTDTEIVLGRSTDGNGDGAFHRLVRYEIAHIAEHGTSL